MENYYLIYISHKKNQDEEFCFFDRSEDDLEFIKTFHINFFNKNLNYISVGNVKRISKEDFEKYKKYDFRTVIHLLNNSYEMNKKKIRKQKIENLTNKVKTQFLNVFKIFIS